MGVVEDVFFSENIDEVFPLISKRTVYSYADLIEILKQKTLILLFRFIALDKEVTFKSLASVGVMGNIQSIRKISNEQYIALRNEK
jgi:hypothetical protein